MAVQVEQHERMTFGLFEVDLRAGELWKAGFRVRLSGQPFRVLMVLLEHAGEVVTREELQVRVWGSNTNVDFERAISGTINKVRDALGDSAENPRFVETLTKRGYRFIAPVTLVNAHTHDKPKALAAHEALPLSGDQHPEKLSQVTVVEEVLPRLSALVPDLADGLPGEREHLKPLLAGPSIRRTWSQLEILLGGVSAVLLAGILVQWAFRRPSELAPVRVSQVTHDVPVSLGPPNVESFLTLVQDGDRILTHVLVNGRSHLSSIITSTGEVQPITMPAEITSSSLADISRDGSRLLLRSNRSSESEQPLWIVPSSGGSGQRVGNVLAHDATWMPDGATILYASGNNLTLFRQDTDVSTPFAALGGRAFWLRWSPTGKVLRFTLINPVTHVSSLWELSNRDRKPHAIPDLDTIGTSRCCGVWTADGKNYVFTADENLWQLSSQRLRELTNGPLRYMSPVAARTGSKIFFIGLEPTSGLQEFDTQQHSFKAAPAFLADANRIEYSRDGVWVAWTDVYERLWRARAADGSDKIRLTSDAMEVFSAHWSPDGKQLAMMARERGSVWKVYTISEQGGASEAVTNDDRNAADPSWSPDGLSLVYGREPDLMGKESGPRNLQVVTLKTRHTEAVPDSEGFFSPRWSPDGRWILALSLDQERLVLFDTRLKRWSQLLAGGVADPVWSADSSSITIHAFSAEREPMLRVSVPQGQVHLVADLSNFHDREYGNYFFGGLTARGEPLVRPRIGTGNLYSLDLAP